MRLTTPGIVLRETKYQEADKLLTVLTRDWGKKTVKARGCRRKNSRLAAGCQLLVYSELTLSEHGPFLTVTEADPLDQFWSLRQDLELLALGSYFAEVCEATVQEGEESGAVLSLLLNSLYALDTLHKPPALVKAAFELRLLCLTGYEPLLDGCAVCGAAEPEDARLLLHEGALCCARCRRSGSGPGRALSPSALAAARWIVGGDPKRLFSFSLDERGLRQLGAAAEGFLLAQHERSYRTLDYYTSLQGLGGHDTRSER